MNRIGCTALFLFLATSPCPGGEGEFALEAGGFRLLVTREGEGHRVELSLADRVAMRSPEQGTWSVGVGWKDEWPATWCHGTAQEPKRLGDWIVLSGEVETPAGNWAVRDSYRVKGAVVEGVRRWQWLGEKPTGPCVLTVRWSTPGEGQGAVLPGILYHGNPSGRSSGEAGWGGVVPLYAGKPGEAAYFEEHRFPAPFVSFEWAESGAAGFGKGAALHSLPSPVPHAVVDDLWWTLGLTAQEDGTELALLSGPRVINGMRGAVKAFQSGTALVKSAYADFPPGAIVEKTFYLEVFPVQERGSGFRRPLRNALDRLGPFSANGLPSVAEIARAKLRFALSRWRENEHPGFAMYPEGGDRHDLYVMGWAGQSEAPGYALQVLAEPLGDPRLSEIARACLDTLARSPFDAGGFQVAYDGKSGEWSRQDPVSQGQAMTNFARAIRFGRRQGTDTSAWESFLRHACDVHATRILAENWRPASTAEAFLVTPLCLGFELFGDDRYRGAALRAVQHYAARHLSMEEPYWGGTLDARCEDKEGAWAGFEAFLAAYDMTGDVRWLQAAGHACDVALTYTYLWDVDLPPGRLRDHDLKTRGWTSVSVQNMHLDVFGVVYAPEIWQLGELTGRRDLQDLALLMYRSCGQMIDAFGS
ncbi:MAG: hypothetical protein V2A76_02230, partial [Planctomycetota bacterium]